MENQIDNHKFEKDIKITLRKLFTILILYSFIFVGAINTNLVPSIYHRIQETYSISSPVPIFIEEAIFIITAAIVGLFWGYINDKFNRNKVLFLASLSLFIGLIITAFSSNFLIFTIGRMITAVGFGAQIPATYSIIADLFPTKHWSSVFASIAFIVAISSLIGNFMSVFLSPLNLYGFEWKYSFLLLALISGFLIISSIIAYLLVGWHLPNKASSSIEEVDEELGHKIREGIISYDFTINLEDLKKLWQKKTNQWIIYMGFVYVIPGATIGTFMIYFLINGPFMSIPASLRDQVAGIFAAGAGGGYMFGTLIFGPIFDKIHKKNKKLRPKYTYIFLIGSIPLFLIALFCVVPIDYSTLNLTNNIDPNNISFSVSDYFSIVSAIFKEYPSYYFYFVLLLLGGLFAAPVSINRSPTLLEINLPEIAGTSQGLLNCSGQMGRGFTSLLLAFQFTLLEFLFISPDLKLIIFISILFYIPAVIWWKKISDKIEVEIETNKEILIQRTLELKDANK